MKVAVGVLAALLAGTAVADVNKCNIGGAVVFQDAPCPGSKVERRDVHPPKPGASAASVAATLLVAPAPAASSSGLKDRLAVYERERRVRDTQQQIESLEDAISGRNAQMTRELAALRDKKRSANNNLAGAQWEQSISTEMSAVADKCRALNEADLQQLGSLRGQLAELQRVQ